MGKTLHRVQGVSLLIAVILLFLPVFFINNTYTVAFIVFVNAIIELFA